MSHLDVLSRLNKHLVSPCLAQSAALKHYSALTLHSLHFVNTSLMMRTQTCSQHIRCSFLGVEQMDIITSLSLQATPLLIQFFVAARAHFWLMFSSLSTWTLRSFSTELLQTVLLQRDPSSQMKDLAFAFAECLEIPISPFLQLAKVSLNGCPACQQVTHFSTSRSKVAEDALCHFVSVGRNGLKAENWQGGL